MGRALLVAIVMLCASTAQAEALIKGFRSAHFGMTKAEVRAAIAKDFPASAVAIEAREATETQPYLLAIPLIRLNPGPTPATVAYAFSGERLVQIDVTWVAPGEATPSQREGLTIAAKRLENYFASLPDKPALTVPGGVLGPNTLLLYGAGDSAGAAIEATIEGINFDKIVDKMRQPSPPPKGPALLRISYRSSQAKLHSHQTRQ